MDIHLGDSQQAFVAESVKSGRYASPSEVVQDALRLMENRERNRKERLEELRKEIAEGIDDLENGRYIDLDDEGMRRYLEDVNRAGKTRIEIARVIHGARDIEAAFRSEDDE